MNNEIWRDIKGYEGLYQISNKGRVKALERRIPFRSTSTRLEKEYIKKTTVSKIGYLVCGLWRNNKQDLRFIHRLVAEAFIENPDNKSEINHKDGNKLNNDISNLEWCTHKENVNHAFVTGLNKHPKPVKLIETGKIYKSLSDAAEDIAGDRRKQSGVGAVARGERNHFHGYHFEFVQDFRKVNGL